MCEQVQAGGDWWLLSDGAKTATVEIARVMLATPFGTRWFT